MFPPFLLRYFSSIITSFNYHSLLFYTLLIMYSHLQILSLFCNILTETEDHRSRFIFFLDFVLFRNAVDVVPYIFKLTLSFIVMGIVWEAWTCIRKTKSKFSKWYFQYTDIINPVLLSLSYQEIQYQGQDKTFHYVFLGVMVVTWFVKIFFVSEDPKYKNWRLEKIGQYLHLMLYCFISLLDIISKYSQPEQMKIWQILKLTFVPIFIVYRIYLSLVRFEYLDEKIEYVQFICRIAELIIILTIISIIYLNISQHYLTLVSFAMILLQRLGIFNQVFQLKYKKILNNVFYLTLQRDAILIIYFLCKENQDKHWIQFDFYKKIREIKCKLVKQITEESPNEIIDNPQTMYFKIKRHICRNFNRKKSNELLGYLAYFHLEQHMYIRALTRSTQIQNNSIQSYLTLCNIKQRLKQFSNIYLKTDSHHNTESQRICRIVSKKQIVNVEKIQDLESFLKDFTFKLLELSEANSQLMNKLCQQQLYQNQIMPSLQQLSQIKEYLQQLRTTNHEKLQSQDVLVLTYLYISYYCCKQSEANTLQPLFYQLKSRFQQCALTNAKAKMVCFVSGKEDQIGRILLANGEMMTELGLSRDRIKYKQQNIDHYIPYNIASKHKKMISEYIDRGTSNFIGKQKQLFLVLNGIAKAVKIVVQLYHNIDKIIFSCLMEITNQREIVLLSDNLGVLMGYSQQASKVFSIKPFDATVNVKEYLCMSRLSNTRALNQKWIQHIKIKNLVYKITTDSVVHKYFTMKIYKLTPIDERNIESNMKLSITNEVKQSDTNIISSGRGTIKTTSTQSKFDERIQRIYTLNFSHKKFIGMKLFWMGLIFFFYATNVLTDTSLNYINNTCIYTDKFIGTVQLEMQTKSPYLIFRNQRIMKSIQSHTLLGQDESFFSMMVLPKDREQGPHGPHDPNDPNDPHGHPPPFGPPPPGPRPPGPPPHHPPNPDNFSQFVLQPPPLMNNTNLIHLYTLLHQLPKTYVSIITDPVFMFHTPTLTVNMSILTLCSYFQTFSQQLQHYNITKFYYDWKANEFNFLTLQDTKIPQMLNSMNGKYLAHYLVYVIVGMAGLYIVFKIVILKKMGGMLRLPSELLAKVSNVIWKQRIQRNAYLKNVIEKIYQNSVYKTEISKPTASQQRIQLQNDYFNVFQQIVQIKDKPKKSGVKKFKVLNFTKKRYYHLITLILLLVPAVILAFAYTAIAKSSFEILNFGVEFNKSILRSYMIANRLLDTVNLYSVDKTLLTQKTDAEVIKFAQTLQSIFKTLYIQDIFKKYKINWNSQMQFLYNNRCPKSDTLCTVLLSGSLQQGFLNGCTTLISKSVITLKQMILRGVTKQIENEMNQLLVFYRMYMYNIFNNAIKFSEDYVKNDIETNQREFKYLSYGYLLLCVVLTLLLAKKITRTIRIIKQMLRETFTILPLNKIKEIRQFEFQLMRITN